MKGKFLTILSAITLLLTLITSCKKEKLEKSKSSGINAANQARSFRELDISEDMSLDEFLTVTDSIGIHHNLCMDYLFDYFDSLRTSNWKTNTADELNFLIRKKTGDYFSNIGFVTQPYNNLSVADSLNTEIQSPAANLLILQINNKVSDFENGIISESDFMESLRQIQVEAFSLTKTNEKFIVGSTASVGNHSFYYWGHLANKFNVFYGSNPYFKTTISNNQAAVGKADLNGAFWGAVGGSLGGVPGAIIGGSFNAAYKSFVKAIEVKTGWDCWYCP